MAVAGSAARQIACWPLLVIVIVALAGCGGGDNSTTATDRGADRRAGGDLDSPVVRRMTAASAGAAAGQIPAPSSGISTAFLRAAFDSAQSLWQQKFEEAGLRYQPAMLTFFNTAIDTPCGRQSPRTGPFYCPAGHGIYLNTDFFDALGRTFGLSSPFAPGYVTAHEVGHHVQQLLGLHARVAAANAGDPSGANNRSVRVELQADCYAGIWLHYVARAGQLSDADVADILRAAEVENYAARASVTPAAITPM
jgi:uncharacterized protein